MPLGQAQQSDGRLQTDPLPRLRLKLTQTQPLRGRVAALFGVVSGIALFLSFPPVDLGPLAYVSLIPLAAIFYRGSNKSILIGGWAFGISFFGSLLYWIRLFGPEAYGGLVGLESGWFALTFWVGAVLARRLRGVAQILVFPATIVAGEYLRGSMPFGGFTWGGLGYSQHDNQIVLRLASFAGVWGLSFLVAGVNSFLWKVYRERPTLRRSLGWMVVPLLALSVPFVLPKGQAEGASIDLAVIQGNAPEGLLDPSVDDIDVLQSHIRLTESLGQSVDLVVWPESALGADPLMNPEFGEPVLEAVRETNAHFLIGATRDFPPGFLNSTLFFSPDARLIGEYNKQHLVPFGEYLPFRDFLAPTLGPYIEQLSLLPRDGVPGTVPQVFDLEKAKVATPICFESTFPSAVREFVQGGARLLIVSTNNSSYARTAASRQHLAFSQIRAAEHHMWVIQAALTGISAAITPDGTIVEQTNLFEPTVLKARVNLSNGHTFYAKTGDWLPMVNVASLAILAVAMIPPARRRRAQGLKALPVEPRTLVVIPTFNEADNVPGLVAGLFETAPEIEVLIVDDGSPDGTADVVDALSRGSERIHLLRRQKKLGLGRAYVDGFTWGLERGFDLFIEMDADFSHDPADLPNLISGIDDAGLVIGSRYSDSGGVEGWSTYRHLLSRTGNLYARAALGFDVADSTSGFRCFRREVLESIALESINSEGYAFQIEMAYQTWQLGYPIREVPIVFHERRAGQSKMSRSIVIEAIAAVSGWGLRDLALGRRFRGR